MAATTFLSPGLVSSIKDERPSWGFRRRLICFRCSSRASCDDSVVGGVPSSVDSWRGVTGW